MFVPFRTQANEARTDPPKKWTTLVFGSNDLPEGPPRPPRARGVRHPCPEDPPRTPAMTPQGPGFGLAQEVDHPTPEEENKHNGHHRVVVSDKQQ